MEDLWAFNEEVVARAIFGSKIPVISAVGHEIDTTIADLVADMRASTPTKAGVVAVPDKKEILEVLTDMERRLAREIDSRMELSVERLQTLLASSVFRYPLLPVRNREQQLDEMGGTLEELIRGILAGAREKLREYYEQVVKIEPHRQIGRRMVELSNLSNRANVGVGAILNKRQMELTGAENRLAGLNPKSVLQRGYSITTNKKTGVLVKNLADVQIEDCIITELAGENLIESKVTNKQNRNN
jgi:exodeoxyribonuclease VII large subunit